MRWLLTWLMVFGVFAGLQGRALAADPCAVLHAMQHHEHDGHHHEPGQPCESAPGEKCPAEPHHHAHCCHAQPLAAEDSALARLGGCGFSRTPIRREFIRWPEEPSADLDKPPLI